tara:strand:+ start:1104 stop:1328 length:225 start_codon:yes stop_codon:yes gene_type:complete
MSEINLYFDALIDKFNNVKDTHPELSKLWINYLILKKNKLNNLHIQAETLLNNLNNTKDISIESVLLLYLIYKK